MRFIKKYISIYDIKRNEKLIIKNVKNYEKFKNSKARNLQNISKKFNYVERNTKDAENKNFNHI